MLESKFQSGLIKELKKKLPGCIVLKTHPNYIQGFPDLIILYGKNWAALECKRNATSTHRPNQDFWVKKLNTMSFSRFIFPENKQEVLNAMVRSFKRLSEGKSCAVQSKSKHMDKRPRSRRGTS